jgi:uncharacterized membrane protein YraQ (UPF0718 family)
MRSLIMAGLLPFALGSTAQAEILASARAHGGAAGPLQALLRSPELLRLAEVEVGERPVSPKPVDYPSKV